MNNIAEVYLWNTKIGVINLREDNPTVFFEYDKDFINNVKNTDIQLSPIKMPISDRVYSFPDLAESFHGVPGMIADSLPDRFGNAIINRLLASIGKTESDFNVDVDK